MVLGDALVLGVVAAAGDLLGITALVGDADEAVAAGAEGLVVAVVAVGVVGDALVLGGGGGGEGDGAQGADEEGGGRELHCDGGIK